MPASVSICTYVLLTVVLYKYTYREVSGTGITWSTPASFRVLANLARSRTATLECASFRLSGVYSSISEAHRSVIRDHVESSSIHHTSEGFGLLL